MFTIRSRRRVGALAASLALLGGGGAAAALATAGPAAAYGCGNGSTVCANASFGTITVGQTLTLSLSSTSFPAFTGAPGSTYTYLDSPPAGITPNGPGTTATMSTNDPNGADLNVFPLADFTPSGLSLTGTPFYIYATEIHGWRAFGASGGGSAQVQTEGAAGTFTIPTGFQVTIPAALPPGSYSGAVAQFVAFAN
jgi:hypothetical protein